MKTKNDARERRAARFRDRSAQNPNVKRDELTSGMGRQDSEPR